MAPITDSMTSERACNQGKGDFCNLFASDRPSGLLVLTSIVLAIGFRSVQLHILSLDLPEASRYIGE